MNKDTRTLASLLKLEENYTITGSYFNATIKPEMRSKLATWMLEVCEEQECTDEVYATAMSIFDRLMCILHQVEVYHLQLLGSVCLFISSKLSSTHKLSACKLVDYTDNSISLEDLLEWELFVMDKLRWDVCSIVPNEFVDIFLEQLSLNADSSVLKRHCYAFTAMCATDFKFAQYPASMIACACIMNALEGLGSCSDLAASLNALANIDIDLLVLIKEREEALTATEKTRQLDEFVRLQKDQRRAPADNFLELKNNIATFMGLVWVLFGSNCDYYKGLRHIYATMDLREVMAIKAHFTAEHCRRITWAIIDDGRSYFDNVKTTLDFGNGASVLFPQSFLVDIIRNVRYGILVDRGNFPQEWLSLH